MNPAAAQIESPAWCPAGPLTVHSVTEARDQLLRHLATVDTVIVDLGGVDPCDCAGLQLLYAARRSAAQAHKPFVIRRCSAAVLAAAAQFGLDPAELGIERGPQ